MIINTAINVVNGVLEAGHLLLQAAQVFPKSPVPQNRGIIPHVVQNPNANLVSALVYRAVKTNLVFLDSALIISQWSARLSEMIPMKHLIVSLGVIRVCHIIHGGLYWYTDNNLTDRKKTKLINDLIANAADVMIYALYFFQLGSTSRLRKSGTIMLMCVDLYCRLQSLGANAIVRFLDNHQNLKADFIKTFLYGANLALNSGLAYSLYRAGTMLVKGSFAFEDYAISKACVIFYGVLTASYGSFYILREFAFDGQDGIAKTTACVIGAVLALIASRVGFPNLGHTLEGFKPQVILALIAASSFGLAKVFMYIVARLIREDDTKRQLLEWTSSLVISGLATAFLAPRLKIVEYTSRLWLSVLQISFLAAGVFLLVEAWYVGLRKLVLTVPPGDNLHRSFEGLLNDVRDWIPRI